MLREVTRLLDSLSGKKAKLHIWWPAATPTPHKDFDCWLHQFSQQAQETKMLLTAFHKVKPFGLFQPVYKKPWHTPRKDEEASCTLFLSKPTPSHQPLGCSSAHRHLVQYQPRLRGKTCCSVQRSSARLCSSGYVLHSLGTSSPLGICKIQQAKGTSPGNRAISASYSCPSAFPPPPTAFLLTVGLNTNWKVTENSTILVMHYLEMSTC